jgi:hypothetical protein
MDSKTTYFVVITTLILLFTGFTFAEIRTSEHDTENDRLVAASKQDLFRAAKKILVLQTFQIQQSDERLGIISTAISPMRVVVDECECGLTQSFGEDRRPIINVSVNIRISENRVAIKAKIHGGYPKNLVTEEMIETDLFHQISRYLD